MRAKTEQARNCCFTQFLSTSECSGGVLLPDEWSDVVYVTWQLEQCPDTGELHFQGYMEFVGKKTWSWVHKNLVGLETAHLERRRGTQAEAITYCMKKESRIEGPWEWGEKRSQGERTDIVEFKKAIDAGKSDSELYDDYFSFMMRYPKVSKQYRRVKGLEVVRDWVPEIEVYIGPSRCGKSRAVRAKYPGAYWKPHGKWWDGYVGQEVVVIDEMYGHRMAFTELLNLLDSTPLMVEPKGDYVQFIAKKIIFTSNQEPEFWYKPEATHQMIWEQNPLNCRLKEWATFFRWEFPQPIPLIDLPIIPEPDFGGQDPTIPIAGMTVVTGHVPDKEIPMPDWVVHPEFYPIDPNPPLPKQFKPEKAKKKKVVGTEPHYVQMEFEK